ncbi:hypothetical protein DFH94DRAFT_757197 [Russula ochroleuca]|jgi:hypothetical protein|uniref:Uncharacterized protein n=1 Tax=Russula ochroleuca TaxID=152965 RepID=A0A9P5T5K4_9AGAM|nr:hypothetical protein DFH94DRAFT_757197 [Russula ochroleuca]
MTFGAPSHRIGSRLVVAIRILEVDAKCTVSTFLSTFADPETCTSETHFIKCPGRLSLENLKMMHPGLQSGGPRRDKREVSPPIASMLCSIPVYIPVCNDVLGYMFWTRKKAAIFLF